MAEEDMAVELLQGPSDHEYPTLSRLDSLYRPLTQFDLSKGEQKQYKQQYGDMYFLRLAKLKPAVEAVAEKAWDGYELAGEVASRVERVLDVRQGQLCWVAGTIYLDMPLKPNILDDIAKDHWIAAPPSRDKYLSPDGHDKVMLEDESGRLRLIGATLQGEMLVTGCIVAVLGTENANGDFEAIDIKIPDLPLQMQRWELSGKTDADNNSHSTTQDATSGSGKVAIVSGLMMTGDTGDSLSLDLLIEWLLGESASPAMQAQAARISRLIIAGNSLADATPTAIRDDAPPTKKTAAANRKYGYDASAYNPAPPQQLDVFLSSLLPSLPITLIPGATDPANVSIPQQPLHPALFPRSRAYAGPPAATAPATPAPLKGVSFAPPPGALHPATNPAAFALAGHLFLGTAGQPTDDMAKYLDSAPPLELLEGTLRWRLLAPTAPDTLWCYPYQTGDPFVLSDGACPHVYFAGCQDAFATRVVAGPEGQSVRVVCVPRFAETGEVVLLDLETLDVELVRFAIEEPGA